jgi:PAS domain S-box-containing protein
MAIINKSDIPAEAKSRGVAVFYELTFLIFHEYYYTMSAEILRILIVEDSEEDTLLLLHELEKGGYEIKWKRVENSEEMGTALDNEEWDAVISDYMMPLFSGPESLELFKSRSIDIPFIIISGEISDQSAVELLKNGAQDFIRKDNMARLLPAIQRELSDAAIRKKERDNENALRKSRELLNNFMDSATDIFILLDSDLAFIEANRICLELIGLDRGEVIGRKFIELFPDFNIVDVCNSLGDVLEKGKPMQQDLSLDLPHAGKRHLDIKIFKVSDGLGVIAHDITELKDAERQIMESLHEKELLLKEIHHRVKNNMQIISSLLNLQKHTIKDEFAREKLDESINRIYSMALVHESLYLSENLSKINVNEYVTSLSAQLFGMFGISSEQINMDIDIDKSLMIDINRAIPFGLILNELILNSFKHAFADLETGEIKISIKNRKKRITIDYHDSGKGLPENFNIEELASLGFILITNLVKQLKGSLNIKKEKGFNVSLIIP